MPAERGKGFVRTANRRQSSESLLTMGDNGDAANDAVVYLLAELRSDNGVSVHEIGSRARVVDSEGDHLTLAVACLSGEDIVRCPRGLVTQAQRSLAARRRSLRSTPAIA